jgi:protein SCO1/2
MGSGLAPPARHIACFAARGGHGKHSEVMMLLKRFGPPLAIFVFFLAMLAAPLFVAGTQQSFPTSVAIGGPFRLTTHDGRALTDGDLKGQPFALFFGFTHCPDVCPTTLFDISELLKELGPEAERLRVLFVTVDPRRDTSDLLATYLQSFPRVIGLTGTKADVAAAAKAYRAYFREVPTKDGSYTMEHTATVYLMNRWGEFFSTLDYHEGRDAKLAKLRRLLRET